MLRRGKKMEYGIASAETTLELKRLVQSLINEGWRPQGGLAIEAHDQYISYYFQAMIRGA